MLTMVMHVGFGFTFNLITRMLLYLQHRIMRVSRYIWVKQRAFIIYWKQNMGTKHSNITYYRHPTWQLTVNVFQFYKSTSCES